jgi:hypothetical protein
MSDTRHGCSISLDARDARLFRRGCSRFCSSRIDRARGRLDPLKRRITLYPFLLPECPSQLFGAFRHFHQDRVDLRPQESQPRTERSDECKDNEKGCQQPWQMPALQVIDDRVEHVKQHYAQHDRKQERRGESHHDDDAARRDDVHRAPTVPERSRGPVAISDRGGGDLPPR